MLKYRTYLYLLSLTLPNIWGLIVAFFVSRIGKGEKALYRKSDSYYIPIILSFILFEVVIILILGYEFELLFKQIFLIIVNLVIYRIVANQLLSHEQRLLEIWKKVSLIMALYALSTYAVGIRYGGRAAMWFGEAGDLSLLLMPIIGYYLFTFKIDKQFYVILVAFLLANSAASFLALFILIVIKVLTLRKYILLKCLFGGFSIILIVYASIASVDENSPARKTLDSFQGVATALQESGSNDVDFEGTTGSVYVYLANMNVAINAPSRLFGTGLGTHVNSYERILPVSKNYFHGLNKEDAYSLGIRIFSELGLFGLLLFILFLYKSFNKGNVINIMAFAYIINATITGGNYAAYGQILFFILFYQTRIKNKTVEQTINEKSV